MHFDFNLTVWGPGYTRYLVEAALPTLLAEGNLPAVTRLGKCRFLFFATTESAQEIARSPAAARLTALMPVEVLTIDNLFATEGRGHNLLSHCHRHAIKLARHHGATSVFLCPDAAWSDGSMAHAARAILAGKRCVMVAGIRACRETFIPALQRAASPATPGVAAVPPRQLVRLLLDHLHPISRDLFWDCPDYNRWPSHLYWAAPDGILVHAFHVHPLMLTPVEADNDFATTIDGDLIAKACPRPDMVELVTDSDHITGVEFSSRAHLLSEYVHPNGAAKLQDMQRSARLPPGASLQALAVGQWAHRWADQRHCLFAQSPIRFHSRPLTPDWRPVETRAADIVRQVLHWRERDPEETLKEVFGPASAVT